MTTLHRGPAPVAGPPTAADDDLDWLADVLGTVSGRRRTYVARPATGPVELLIPARPAAVAVGALHRTSDDRGRAQRLSASLARRAAGLGALPLAPGRRLELPPYELVDELGRALGEDDVVAAITLGPRRRNRKPVLQLLRPDGQTVGFAKVGWSHLTGALVANEAEVLRLVAGHLPPIVAAPRVLHRRRWRGAEVAVTTPLPLAGRRRRSAVSPYDVMTAVARVGRRRAAVAELAPVAEWTGYGLGRHVDLDRLLERHGGVELDVGLWHGDLTPWNMATVDDAVAVWDWEFAGLDRPAGFDALHRRFERLRRGRMDAGTALRTVIATAHEIVAPLRVPTTPDGLRSVTDLYLCELLSRELRLTDQRWANEAMAAVGPAAATLLAERLR
ncbi:MAG: hypothetical protein ACFCVK_25875 [Acidimicrobiales bacterium]